MKVLFIQDVAGTAYAGDVKEVRDGFARNYLLPEKMAVNATKDQLNRVKGLQEAASKRRVATEAEMASLSGKLNGATITILARSGRNNRLYGSITNGDVATELTKLAGREIDRRKVILMPVRQLGTYQVPVKLAHGIEPHVTLVVASAGQDTTMEPTVDEIMEAEAEAKQKHPFGTPEAKVETEEAAEPSS